MKNMLNTKFFSIFGIMLIAAFSRLIPHPPNVTPIISIALFGGILFSDKKIALIAPLAAMILSDIFIGFHGSIWAVYISIAAISLIGYYFIKQAKFLNIIGFSLLSSILFFAVSNFGMWLMMGLYPMTFSGLLLCYEAAIPFFRNTLISTLAFSSVFYLAYSMALKYVPDFQTSTIEK